MKAHIRKIVPLLAALPALALHSSQAYIDPGTTGIVIGSAWTYIIGICGVISGYIALKFIKPVKEWLRKRNNEKKR